MVRNGIAKVGANRLGHALHEARVMGDCFHPKHQTFQFHLGSGSLRPEPSALILVNPGGP